MYGQQEGLGISIGIPIPGVGTVSVGSGGGSSEAAGQPFPYSQSDVAAALRSHPSEAASLRSAIVVPAGPWDESRSGSLADPSALARTAIRFATGGGTRTMSPFDTSIRNRLMSFMDSVRRQLATLPPPTNGSAPTIPRPTDGRGQVPPVPPGGPPYTMPPITASVARGLDLKTLALYGLGGLVAYKLLEK